MDPSVIVSLVVGAGLLGGIGMGIKAWLERGQLQANADALRANADSIVAAAARELLDPLRKELAQERLDHVGEIEIERKKVADVRRELDAAVTEVQALRVELAALRGELRQARLENARAQTRIRDLEATRS